MLTAAAASAVGGIDATILRIPPDVNIPCGNVFDHSYAFAQSAAIAYPEQGCGSVYADTDSPIAARARARAPVP